MLDNLRMYGRIAFKLGIQIIHYMIHVHTWQKFLFNLSINNLKMIANKNITPQAKVTKSRNGNCDYTAEKNKITGWRYFIIIM